jgi:membrane-associated protease RseP (regulator of RpoE activity)
MLFLLLGLVVCSAAFLGGRWAGHRAFGIKGARVLAPEADEAYFGLSRARRWLWRLAGPVAVYGLCVLLGLAALRANGNTVATTTVEVLPGGPAARAGMLTGDRIVSVNGVATTTWEEVPKLVAAGAPAGRIAIQVRRGADERLLTVVPDEGKIMVRSQMERRSVPIAEALPEAIVAPLTTLVRQVVAAWTFVTGHRQAKLAGPVGIVREVGDASAGPSRAMAVGLFFLATSAQTVWPLVILLELVLGPRRRRGPAASESPGGPTGDA